MWKFIKKINLKFVLCVSVISANTESVNATTIYDIYEGELCAKTVKLNQKTVDDFLSCCAIGDKFNDIMDKTIKSIANADIGKELLERITIALKKQHNKLLVSDTHDWSKAFCITLIQVNDKLYDQKSIEISHSDEYSCVHTNGKIISSLIPQDVKIFHELVHIMHVLENTNLKSRRANAVRMKLYPNLPMSMMNSYDEGTLSWDEEIYTVFGFYNNYNDVIYDRINENNYLNFRNKCTKVLYQTIKGLCASSLCKEEMCRNGTIIHNFRKDQNMNISVYRI